MSYANPERNTNIILAGVGGQGSITAGQIAARAASLSGMGVVMSEVHGMAQRGGSVMSTVRYGDAQSPVVSAGQADFLLGFEKLEALRYAPYLSASGVAIVSDQKIIPTIEALKSTGYPVGIEAQLSVYTNATLMLPALGIAERIGNARLIGTVILGSFSAFMDIPWAHWEQAIGETVPPKTIALNLKAFENGYEFAIDTAVLSEFRHAGKSMAQTATDGDTYFESA